jgi:hypothetical protein
MYCNDHGIAHFHAVYERDHASISIDRLDFLDGRLPRRVLTPVLEWAFLHRPELRANWVRAQEHLPLAPVAPLE